MEMNCVVFDLFYALVVMTYSSIFYLGLYRYGVYFIILGDLYC